MEKITVKDTVVTVVKVNNEDYINLTDMLQVRMVISISLVG